MATQLTEAGFAAGTPAFMAPEIAIAHPAIDGRADLYALGCVAYYLLTGQFVFAADTPIAAALAHVNDQPAPPSARSPFQIPARLEALILQCLAKDPAERPASAVDWRIGWRKPSPRTPGLPTRHMRGGTSTGCVSTRGPSVVQRRTSPCLDLNGGSAGLAWILTRRTTGSREHFLPGGGEGDGWPIRACWRPPSPAHGPIPLSPLHSRERYAGFRT